MIQIYLELYQINRKQNSLYINNSENQLLKSEYLWSIDASLKKEVTEY